MQSVVIINGTTGVLHLDFYFAIETGSSSFNDYLAQNPFVPRKYIYFTLTRGVQFRAILESFPEAIEGSIVFNLMGNVVFSDYGFLLSMISMRAALCSSSTEWTCEIYLTCSLNHMSFLKSG